MTQIQLNVDSNINLQKRKWKLENFENVELEGRAYKSKLKNKLEGRVVWQS
jgi:hypothetical protein